MKSLPKTLNPVTGQGLLGETDGWKTCTDAPAVAARRTLAVKRHE
jgi:hypothetical protein